MYRAIALACVCLLASQAGLWGDGSPSQTVAELVKDLSSNDFQVRDAAIKAIEKLGPDALGELKKHKDHPDLEVRRHIEKWIPLFEKDLFVRPKRLTLKLVDRPLQEAVALLAKQTGYKIELAKDEEKDKNRFSFQLDNVTFWEALERICKEGEVEAQAGENDALMLHYSETHSPFVHQHGAFRMRAGNLHFNAYSSTSKNIQFAALPRKGPAPMGEEHKSESKNVQFSFTVGAEPRLPMTGVGAAMLAEAVDDKDQSLLPKREENGNFGIRGGRFRAMAFAGGGRFFGGHEQHASVQLLPPSEGARSIKLLRGSVPVLLEKEKKTTVVLDNLKNVQGKKLKVGKMMVEIDYFKESARGRYSLYVTMTRDKPANNNDEDSDELDGALELQDDKGNSYGIHGSGTSSDGSVTEAHYTFGAPFNGGNIGAPAKLVYVTRTTMEYLVPFEFRDLPLP